MRMLIADQLLGRHAPVMPQGGLLTNAGVRPRSSSRKGDADEQDSMATSWGAHICSFGR